MISLNGAYRILQTSANSNTTELGLQSANRTFQWCVNTSSLLACSSSAICAEDGVVSCLALVAASLTSPSCRLGHCGMLLNQLHDSSVYMTLYSNRTQHNATSPIKCTSKPGVDVERLQQCFGGMARPGKVVNIIDFPDVLGTTVILGRALQLFGNNQDGVTTTMAVDIEDGQCIPVYQKSQNIVTYSDFDQLVLYHDFERDVQLPGSAFSVPGECYKAIQD